MAARDHSDYPAAPGRPLASSRILFELPSENALISSSPELKTTDGPSLHVGHAQADYLGGSLGRFHFHLKFWGVLKVHLDWDDVYKGSG